MSATETPLAGWLEIVVNVIENWSRQKSQERHFIAIERVVS